MTPISVDLQEQPTSAIRFLNSKPIIEMKNILLLTDFSAAAEDAAHYAVELANQQKADITVFHSYQVYSTTGSFISVERFILEDLEKDLGKALQQVRAKLKPGSSAVAKHVKGDTVPTLAKIADEGAYDLVVMGNHGSGERKSIFWGSTTSGIVQKTKANVLAIPQGYVFTKIKNIVLAVDESGFGTADISILKSIATAFGAKIWIYHAQAQNGHADIPIEMSATFSGIEHEYYIEKENSIEDGIKTFAEEKDADILCMIKRTRGFWESFFRKSMTIEKVFNSPVPLLALHDA